MRRGEAAQLAARLAGRQAASGIGDSWLGTGSVSVWLRVSPCLALPFVRSLARSARVTVAVAVDAA